MSFERPFIPDVNPRARVFRVDPETNQQIPVEGTEDFDIEDAVKYLNQNRKNDPTLFLGQ